MDKKTTVPFLKWPGGKRWLTHRIIDRIPRIEGNYIEPFLGGGAFFFALNPTCAKLSDINAELIETYKVMRDKPELLREKMLCHQKYHNKEYYYKIRSMKPRTDINRASRFIYLNRTCFNGMYRVNKKGEFNVPKGTKDNFTYDIDVFEEYSTILKNAELLTTDFEIAIESAKKGDLIFADPPYAMNSGSQFIKYNDKLFTWEDQKRLFDSLKKASQRGAHVILTNAFCEELKTMYEEAGFFVVEITRACSISGKAVNRQRVKELLISTYDFGEMENVIDE